MSTTNYLLEFAKKLEQKNIVNAETGIKIRGLIRKEESPSNWQMFLVLGGILGALFASAGIFAIISHNWYDLSKHVKGFISLIPTAVALYFYYLAIFKHKDSKTWVEASSLFLMLMIGASMALITQTYQMDGEFMDFIKVWLALTIPLFYIAKASAISLFYLALSCVLLSDIEFDFEQRPFPFVINGLYWFWLFILAFIPHYYLSLNRDSKKQGTRVVYMSYLLYFAIVTGISLTIKSNFLLWGTTCSVGFYLFGKRFMSDNKYVLNRPFQWLSQLSIVSVLGILSYRWYQYAAMRTDSLFELGEWEGNQWYYFVLLLVVMGGVYFNFFRDKEKFGEINYLVVFAPFFIIFMMLLDVVFDSWWLSSIVINLYILFLGITTIIHGSANGQVFKMVAGLAAITLLLAFRYFDNDLGFITKGIVFLAVGGGFFMMNLLIKDKVEDIERHKKLSE